MAINSHNNTPTTLPVSNIRESIAQQIETDRKVFNRHQSDIAKQDKNFGPSMGGSGRE